MSDGKMAVHHCATVRQDEFMIRDLRVLERMDVYSRQSRFPYLIMTWSPVGDPSHVISVEIDLWEKTFFEAASQGRTLLEKQALDEFFVVTKKEDK